MTTDKKLWRDSQWGRIVLLVGAAGLGVASYRWLREFVYRLLDAGSDMSDPAINGILLGICVFLLLWWFRTR